MQSTRVIFEGHLSASLEYMLRPLVLSSTLNDLYRISDRYVQIPHQP